MNIFAVLTLLALGAALGAMLGIANKFLYVEDDPRVTTVLGMLPGANCGGCGFPGCGGFANALVEGEATKVSACVVSNAETRQNVVAYLNETPGPDGTCVKVTI